MRFQTFVGPVDGIFHIPRKGAFEFGLIFFGEFAHAPSGKELGKSFVEGGAIGFVGSYHPKEPVVTYFVGDEALVAWVLTSVHGNHGVFHTICGICTNDFWVIVHAEISTIGSDDFGGKLGGLLPSGCVIFLGDGDAFYAFPFYFTYAISGIGGPSEIVDIIGMKLPALAFSGCGDNDGGLRSDGCFFEVRNINLLSQGGWHGFGFVLKQAGGFHDVMIGQV